MHRHWKSEQYNELTLMTLLGVSLLRIKLDNPRVRQDNDFYKTDPGLRCRHALEAEQVQGSSRGSVGNLASNKSRWHRTTACETCLTGCRARLVSHWPQESRGAGSNVVMHDWPAGDCRKLRTFAYG